VEAAKIQEPRKLKQQSGELWSVRALIIRNYLNHGTKAGPQNEVK